MGKLHDVSWSPTLCLSTMTVGFNPNTVRFTWEVSKANQCLSLPPEIHILLLCGGVYTSAIDFKVHEMIPLCDHDWKALL